MENKDITNKEVGVVTAVGYDKQDLELVLNLLNTIPVKTYVETQAKSQIYEILMNPKYNFEPPVEEK